jgi:hypothetical protein
MFSRRFYLLMLHVSAMFLPSSGVQVGVMKNSFSLWLYSPLGLGRFFNLLIFYSQYNSFVGGSARRKVATYT